jgi:hypothetical protein
MMTHIFLSGMTFLYYAVAGAILILSVSFIRRTSDKYLDVCVSVGLLACLVILTVPLGLTVRLHPHTVDWLLYRADRAIGLDPLPLARLVYSTAWLHYLLWVCYSGLPLMISIAWATERPRAMFPAMLASAGMAFLCYNLLPAVGPAHAFDGFPFAAAHLAAVDNPTSPRDCIPSMHLGWSLLILWNVRGRVLKACAWIFVGLTVLATVGLGEHYFVDLIAAVPFCYAVQMVSVSWASRKGFAQQIASQVVD